VEDILPPFELGTTSFSLQYSHSQIDPSLDITLQYVVLIVL